MNCGNKTQKLALLAAVVAGILTYAFFEATEISAVAGTLFPAILIIGLVGLVTLLLAAARACECDGLRSCFCANGITAALGGAGAILATIFTLLVGADTAAVYRVGTAIAVGLLTLLLGGIIGLLADYFGCVSCSCSCPCDNAEAASDGGFVRNERYYRR